MHESLFTRKLGVEQNYEYKVNNSTAKTDELSEEPATAL